MHEKGYTFGPGRIEALTQDEIDQIMLGHLVKQEREKEASEEAGRPNRRQYSEPAKSTEEAMQEYSQKHDLRQPEQA